METVNATDLKNRLGEVLAVASLRPVAIERHGRVVAWLVPPPGAKAARKAPRASARRGLKRHEEERLLELCAGGDFRPSRWLRAGDPYTLAGLAAMLASVEGFERTRLLSLAERLHPGMSAPREFGRWLRAAPVDASRFLPMLAARRKAKERES
jgi:antitoxin (DNA-binding transcriptional repressor) of toxin-antitoxin stability system